MQEGHAEYSIGYEIEHILQYHHQRGNLAKVICVFHGEEYLQGKCVPVCLGCVIVGGLHEYFIGGGAVDGWIVLFPSVVELLLLFYSIGGLIWLRIHQ